MVYFQASERIDGRLKRASAHCTTCQRIANRIRHGHTRRDPRSPAIVKLEELARRRHRTANLTPEERAARRQYHREYEIMRRRDAGIPPRNFAQGSIDREEVMRLPVTQEFKDWLAAAFENHRFLEAEVNIGVSNKQIRKLLRGAKKIDMDTAERLLLYANGPMPWELWPDELGVD